MEIHVIRRLCRPETYCSCLLYTSLRLGGNDILLPAVGKFHVPAERPVELLGASLLEHALAIRGIADHEALVRRQAHLGRVCLAEVDQLPNARFSGVVARNIQGCRINIGA